MIHKSTEDKIKELRECIERTEGFKQGLSARDAALIGIKVSQMKEELKGSYTEQTPLWEVQGLIEKEIKPLHDKAYAIKQELCRIYESPQDGCYRCPLSMVDNDRCLEALEQHLVCQFLITKYHV